MLKRQSLQLVDLQYLDTVPLDLKEQACVIELINEWMTVKDLKDVSCMNEVAYVPNYDV